MATALQSETTSYNQNIFTVINDLKKKRKRADIKTIDFKDYQGYTIDIIYFS